MRSGHGTFWTLGLRGLGLGLSVGSSLIAARLLGAREFGTYSLLLAWATVLGVLAVDGLDTLLTRELATSAPSSHRAARRWASRRAGQRRMGSTGVHGDPALSSHFGHAKGTRRGLWRLVDRQRDPSGSYVRPPRDRTLRP